MQKLAQRHAERQARQSLQALAPKSGYQQLYIDRVLQADEGCDFDFLVGCRGAEVPRHSHQANLFGWQSRRAANPVCIAIESIAENAYPSCKKAIFNAENDICPPASGFSAFMNRLRYGISMRVPPRLARWRITSPSASALRRWARTPGAARRVAGQSFSNN